MRTLTSTHTAAMRTLFRMRTLTCLRAPPSDSRQVPQTARRAALVTGASGLLLALTLPNAPEYWSSAAVLESELQYSHLDSAGPWIRPLLTMLGMGALTVAGWKAFGADMHPITAKARGLEPAPALAFQVLGLGGAMLGAAALASGWY